MPIIAAIMAGTIPGALILQNAPPDIIKLLLGLVVVGAGIEMATRLNGKQKNYNKYVMYIISFLSGVSGAIFGIAFFYVAYLGRAASDRNSLRSSVCFIFMFENVFRFIVYWVSGFFTAELIYMLLAAIPGVIIGMATARIVDKKISDRTQKIMVIAVFIAGGVSAFINALIAMI